MSKWQLTYINADASKATQDHVHTSEKLKTHAFFSAVAITAMTQFHRYVQKNHPMISKTNTKIKSNETGFNNDV